MKYIDVGLSATNLTLLDAWIERRLSGAHFPDARDPEARAWWDSLMRERQIKGAIEGWTKQPLSRIAQQNYQQALSTGARA